ncbi:MAG TPA: helix-turn-helix transcriptional regulator [Polyangia bacterium]|nr:helix-turn-helix transcriptional regulator [Polyangia bacterium]
MRRVAQRVAAVRREKGMTQETMAARLDCALKNYQRIESRDGQNLTIKTLARIANILGVTVTDLVPPPAGRRRKALPADPK